jgi:hypothetical protein
VNQIYPVTSGNPYGPGQVITAYDCAGVTGASGSGGQALAVPGTYTVQGVGTGSTTYTTGQTGGWANNLAAACSNDADYYRPFSGISGITRIEPAGSSSYNGLEVSGRRTMGGLTLDVAYTYSHSIDDSSDRYDAGFVNSYNWAAYRASSSFDVRQILNVSYIYDLPFFKKPGLSHSLLGGWQWSGIASYSGGTPFSVVNRTTYGDNAGVSGGGAGSYADKIGDPYTNIPPSPGGPQIAGFLYNPNAYTTPQGLTFGNSGRNSLRNPSRTNFDMALFKSFAVTESKHFEFRAEAFNVFNHTEWIPLAGDAGSGGSNNSGGTNGYGPSNFFQFLGAHNPRILQLGAKFIF